MGLLSKLGLGAMGGNIDPAMMGILPMMLQGGGEQQSAAPPMMPQVPRGGGFMGAFSNSPDFQSQLGQIMQGQGPGMQAPQMMGQPQMPAPMINLPMQGGSGGNGRMPNLQDLRLIQRR